MFWNDMGVNKWWWQNVSFLGEFWRLLKTWNWLFPCLPFDTTRSWHVYISEDSSLSKLSNFSSILEWENDKRKSTQLIPVQRTMPMVSYPACIVWYFQITAQCFFFLFYDLPPHRDCILTAWSCKTVSSPRCHREQRNLDVRSYCCFS